MAPLLDRCIKSIYLWFSARLHACTVTRCTTEVSSFVRRIVVVYIYITLFTDILTFECMLGHQSLGVCEVSEFKVLGETHTTCGCLLLFTN